jgi:glutamate racemase
MGIEDRPIGVYDSGVGGLTVVREIIKQLPHEEIVYFGDTARVPYGSKSRETITRFAVESMRFLSNQNIKMVVIACNTVSASSIPALRKYFKIPILGVIKPGAAAAVKKTKNKVIGIIGTERTVSSKAYDRVIRQLDPEIKILSRACPLFVPLVEEGWLDKKATLMIASEYLEPLKQQGIDTLVLACTHYPLLKNTIRKVMGNGINMVDSAEETARAVKHILQINGMYRKTSNPPEHRFFVSDTPTKFVEIGERFLSRKFRRIHQINIENYGEFGDLNFIDKHMKV